VGDRGSLHCSPPLSPVTRACSWMSDKAEVFDAVLSLFFVVCLFEWSWLCHAVLVAHGNGWMTGGFVLTFFCFVSCFCTADGVVVACFEHFVTVIV
jgi:hypothetical protein